MLKVIRKRNELLMDRATLTDALERVENSIQAVKFVFQLLMG